MDWDLFVEHALLPALVVLLTGAAGFYLARAERRFTQVHKHASTLTGVGMEIDQLKEYVAATKGYGERLRALEVKVGNIETTTGEIKVDIRELLRHARKANGGAG